MTKLVEILLRDQHRELRHLVIRRTFTKTSSASLQKFAAALSFRVRASGSAHTIVRNGAKIYRKLKKLITNYGMKKFLKKRTYLWKERAPEIEFEVPMLKDQGTPDFHWVLEARRRW